MKTGLKQVIILAAFSVISIVFYGCSTTNFAVNKNQKFHVYACKSDKLICNLSDSTTVVIYPGPDQDKSTLDLFESGNLTVKMLLDIVDQQVHDVDRLYNNYWYEFDVIQPEISRTYSDTCKDFVEDEKTIFIISSSSIVDDDGNTLHGFNCFIGYGNQDFNFDLKQIRKDHFALRFGGFNL